MFRTLIKRDLKIVRTNSDRKSCLTAYLIISALLLTFLMNIKTPLSLTIVMIFMWAAFIFSAISRIKRIFLSDHEDGSLQILLLKRQNVSLIAAKIFVDILISFFPLLLSIPIIALFFVIKANLALGIVIPLSIGLLNISLINILAASICLLFRNRRALGAIVVSIVSVPVAILGIIAANLLIIDNDIYAFWHYNNLLFTIMTALLPLSFIIANRALKLVHHQC